MEEMGRKIDWNHTRHPLEYKEAGKEEEESFQWTLGTKRGLGKKVQILRINWTKKKFWKVTHRWVNSIINHGWKLEGITINRPCNFKWLHENLLQFIKK